MLITSSFEVAQPLAEVWKFFGNIPQVAACLPGAKMTDDLGNDTYGGNVGIRVGPVKMEFDGKAAIKERDDAAHRIVIDASGADRKGRGQAAMLVTARLAATPRGTKVDVQQDLQLSGAAAQYGRGMINDVNAVLLRDFSVNVQNRIDAIARGLDPDSVAAAKPASGLAIGLQATKMALLRVFRRFFLPYRPATELRSAS